MRSSWVVCSLLLLLASSEAISVHDRVRTEGVLRRVREIARRKGSGESGTSLLQVAASEQVSAGAQAQTKELVTFLAIGAVLLLFTLVYQGVKWYRQRRADSQAIDTFKTDTVPRMVCEARLQGYAMARSLELQTQIAAGIVNSPGVCGGDRDLDERAFDVPEAMCERLNALEDRMDAGMLLRHLQAMAGSVVEGMTDQDFDARVTGFVTSVTLAVEDAMNRVRRLEENALLVDAGAMPFMCPPRASCREVVASAERMQRMVEGLLEEARQTNAECMGAREEVSSMFTTQLLDLHERLGMAEAADDVAGVDGVDGGRGPAVMDGMFASMDAFRAAMVARGQSVGAPQSHALGRGAVTAFTGQSVVDSVFSTLVALGTYDIKQNAPTQDVTLGSVDLGWNFQWLAGGGVALTLALLTSVVQYFVVDRVRSGGGGGALQGGGRLSTQTILTTTPTPPRPPHPALRPAVRERCCGRA